MKRIWCIPREERWPMVIVFLYFSLLNGLFVVKFFDKISPKLHGGLWYYFIRYFHISGYDSKAYSMITRWSTEYDVYRHPLFNFFLYPLYWLDQGLMRLTGVNCVQWIWAVCQVILACVAYHYLYKILREVLKLSQTDTILLTGLFFSMAYIQLAFVVPDHFSWSLPLLLMVLEKGGKRMLAGEPLKKAETALLFLLVAGTTLTNGVKVWLTALFANGRSFFRPTFLMTAVVLPVFILAAVSRYADVTFAQPRALDLLKSKKKTPVVPHTESPKDHIKKWIDTETPRVPSLVENMFGESVQFHQEYSLGDISNPKHPRPVFVSYSHIWNYAVEAGYVFLFLFGLYCGRRERFMQLVLACFCVELLVHVVLGFGLKDVYIMSAHWLFILPIAYSYILKRHEVWLQKGVRGILLLLTVGLWLYNGSRLVNEWM